MFTCITCFVLNTLNCNIFQFIHFLTFILSTPLPASAPNNKAAKGESIQKLMADNQNPFAALLSSEGGGRKQRRKKRPANSPKPPDVQPETSTSSTAAESSIFTGQVRCSADGSLGTGGLPRMLSSEKRSLGRQGSENMLRVRTGSGGQQSTIQRKGEDAGIRVVMVGWCALCWVVERGRWFVRSVSGVSMYYSLHVQCMKVCVHECGGCMGDC